MPFDPSAVRSGSTFSTNPIYQAAWICYINGIETPIMGFDTQCGVWQIPSFTIQMMPDVLLQRLGNEDRVPVQIFYLDYWFDPEKPEFRLLVDGEIIGWSYSSASGQRTMSFSCLAHIHIFQQLYFFYMTNVDDIVASQAPEVQAQGTTQAGLLYPYSLFHQGILVTQAQREAATPPPPRRPGQNPQQTTPPAQTDPDAGLDADSPARPIKAPFELLYNVIKGIISTDVPANRRAIPMINFFARHTRKVRFQNRFVRLPFLEDPDHIGDKKGLFPIFNAARNDEAVNAMQRQCVSQIGNSGPVWNLLQQVYSMVYMEIAMIPNPAAVIVALGKENGEPQDGKIIGILSSELPIVTQNPLVASAAISSEQPSPTQEDDFIARGIRAGINNVLTPNPEDDILARGVRGLLGQTTTPTSINTTPTSTPSTNHEGTNPTTPIRLAQYFVKPQFLFAIPPHCNVIFPSMIDAWTYDEPYMTQPTRIYVNDSVMTQLLRAQGSNRHFMLHALTVAFPEEAEAVLNHKIGGDTDSETTQATPGMMESGKNLLIWPEEYYKGPVTAKLALPSWFQMLRQFSNGNQPDTDPDAAPPATPTHGTTPNPSTAGTTTPTANVPAAPHPPITAVFVPPTISNERRGQVATRDRAQPDFAYRWIVSPETLSTGNNKTVHYSMPTYRDLELQINGVLGQPVARWQRPIPDSFRILQDHLRSIFNATPFTIHSRRTNQDIQVTAIQSFYTLEGHHKVDPPRNQVADPHTAGRAMDINIRTVIRGRQFSLPDLEHGSPIAEYLIQNCDVFGVQIVIWARSQWASGARSGHKFTHYTAQPDSEAMDHFNHIHMELSEDAAAGRLPFYANARSSSPTRPSPPARTVFGPPNRTATTAPIAPNQSPGATTHSIPVAQPGTATAPSATRTVTREVPTTPTANTEDTQTTSNDTFQELFRLYAQYEYLRQRYMVRQAAVQMQFNPYLVPGFPSMLFDSMRTRFHIVGYIQNISHSAQAGGSGNIRTQVQMTCCRTLPEFINDVRSDAERFASRVTAAPAEIIDEIRVQVQDETNAEAFYRRLFYGDGPRPGNVPTAFRWDQAMGYSRGMQVENIQIIGQSTAQSVTQQEAQTGAQGTETTTPEPTQEDDFIARGIRAGINNVLTPNPEDDILARGVRGLLGQTTTPTTSTTTPAPQQNTVTHNLDPNQELSPLENIYQDAFDRYDIAMQLASRPACTLTQYIRFWHGGMTINDLINQQIVNGPQDGFAYMPVVEVDVIGTIRGPTGNIENIRTPQARKTAIYYDRIFRLRPGPGTGTNRLEAPSVPERGYTDPPNVHPSPTHAAVPATYPQTRADWDSVLEQYRQKVRTLLRPST